MKKGSNREDCMKLLRKDTENLGIRDDFIERCRNRGKLFG